MKKVFKKTVALLLAVVLLCGMMPPVSHAVSEYTIFVSDSVDGTATVKAGETVKFSVIVEGSGFNGMEAVLTYDKALLRLENAEGAAVQSYADSGEVELYTLRHEPYASGACVAELIFTALGDKEKAKELFRRLIPLKIKWVSQGSIDMLEDNELMTLMVKSGCLGHVIGFESIKPDSIHTMGKGVNKKFVQDQYRDAIKKLRKYGL